MSYSTRVCKQLTVWKYFGRKQCKNCVLHINFLLSDKSFVYCGIYTESLGGYTTDKKMTLNSIFYEATGQQNIAWFVSSPGRSRNTQEKGDQSEVSIAVSLGTIKSIDNATSHQILAPAA